jgi:hypothetical protein
MTPPTMRAGAGPTHEGEATDISEIAEKLVKFQAKVRSRLAKAAELGPRISKLEENAAENIQKIDEIGKKLNSLTGIDKKVEVIQGSVL